MIQALFKTGSDFEQNEHRLSEEVTKLKDDLKAQAEKFDEVNK